MWTLLYDSHDQGLIVEINISLIFKRFSHRGHSPLEFYILVLHINILENFSFAPIEFLIFIMLALFQF